MLQQIYQVEIDMNIQEILQKNYVQDLVTDICGEAVEILERKDCYIVRSKVEGERDIHRLIILPPKGFTANEINQMNSHDEAESATIQVKGAVKEGKRSFSKLSKCLLVASSDRSERVSDLNQPYLTFGLEAGLSSGLDLKQHSSGESPFYVVKSDGYGFYHNLVNVTDEWLVLKLHKILRPQRGVNLERVTKNIQDEQADILKNLYFAIVHNGDNVFSVEPAAVRAVMSVPLKDSLPVLGEMLHVHDSGMHEACTVFAIILKIAKFRPKETYDYLVRTLVTRSIPAYYANQLIGKIENMNLLDGELAYQSAA